MKTITTIHWDFQPWEFHYSIFVEEGGKIYGATDSGCSCPTPFEYHEFPKDYVLLRNLRDFDLKFPLPEEPDPDSWGAKDYPQVVDSYTRGRKDLEEAFERLARK